jgi:hypothetical protein
VTSNHTITDLSSLCVEGEILLRLVFITCRCCVVFVAIVLNTSCETEYSPIYPRYVCSECDPHNCFTLFADLINIASVVCVVLLYLCCF